MTTEGETRPLEAAVRRARDPEPDRVRGHVPAARGAARPLPDPRSASATRAASTRSRCSARRPSAARTRSSSRPSSTRRRSSRCSARSSRCTCPTRSRATSSTSSPRRATSRRLAVGASPRGSLALLKLSRAKAALAGRDFVVPEDVKAVAVPALAHRLTLRPELWVQRVRGEDVVAEALETVPTPPAEDARRRSGRDDAARLAATRRLREPRRGRAARGPRPRPRRARRARRPVRARRGRSAALARKPELEAELVARPRARARERDGRTRRSSSSSRARASTALDVSCCPARELLPTQARNPRGDSARCRRAANARAAAALRPLGRVRPSARRSSARATGSASTAWETQAGGRRRPARLPERRDAARAAAAARDAGVRRQPGVAHEGRRNRVRRHPRVGARRPPAARQLARERAPRRALGERAASGAKH